MTAPTGRVAALLSRAASRLAHGDGRALKRASTPLPSATWPTTVSGRPSSAAARMQRRPAAGRGGEGDFVVVPAGRKLRQGRGRVGAALDARPAPRARAASARGRARSRTPLASAIWPRSATRPSETSAEARRVLAQQLRQAGARLGQAVARAPAPPGRSGSSASSSPLSAQQPEPAVADASRSPARASPARRRRGQDAPVRRDAQRRQRQGQRPGRGDGVAAEQPDPVARLVLGQAPGEGFALGPAAARRTRRSTGDSRRAPRPWPRGRTDSPAAASSRPGRAGRPAGNARPRPGRPG